MTSIIFVLESPDIRTSYASDKIVSYQDKIKIKDDIDSKTTKPPLLSDKIRIKDDIDFKKTKPPLLSDKIRIKDDIDTTVTHYGTITIKTLQKVPGSLVLGASYTISPNPKTGTGKLLVTDGGAGDENGISDGMIKISQVPHGKYVINQVAVPPGFSSLLGSTIKNVQQSHLNQIATFQVLSTSTDLTKLSSTPITSPSLDNDTFNKFTSSSAKIVNKTNSGIINDIDQTPQIIVAGSKNSTAINTSISSISSISLSTSFAPLTKGSTIINTIGLENYSLPNSTNLVSIIPTIVARVNATTDYVAATPPLSGIIPGQEMIIPVTDSLLPSFGGLKKIDVQSSPSVNSGKNNANWFVFEVDNKIPASIGSVGIANTPEFFVNLQHPFEESGSGFNWSNPSNLDVPPTLTIIVDKTNLSSIKIDSEGCPVVDAYSLVSGSWTTSGVGEISSKSVSSSQCEITIQSQHLSKFAFSLQHLISLTHSSDGPSRSGTVSTGTGQSPSNTAAAVIQSTTPTPPLGLTATAASTQINLHWAAPTNNGGSPITGYKIERSTNAGYTWYTITNTGNTATTYSNTGLASGTTYTYRVSAINVIGTSSQSVTTSATIYTVPTGPVVLTATATSTQINLRWAAPTNNGGSPIIGYKIERSTNGGYIWSTIITNTGSTETTYSNTVTSSTTYTYRVSAINVIGPSSPSNVASATIYTMPTPPVGLAASSSLLQINLHWAAPTNNGGSPITGYKIERSTNAGYTWYTITNTGNTATTYSNTGLASGTTYTYRVSAINVIGTSSPSNTAATTASQPTTPSTTPSKLTTPTVTKPVTPVVTKPTPHVVTKPDTPVVTRPRK